jgi:hypothetical protein
MPFRTPDTLDVHDFAAAAVLLVTEEQAHKRYPRAALPRHAPLSTLKSSQETGCKTK